MGNLLGAIRPTLLLLAFCTGTMAGAQSLYVSQYAHTAWRVRDGFVKGAITAIKQTPDGYLWLGTEFGLVRFDGVRIVPWKLPRGGRLPGSYIRDLLVTRDSTLWIATLTGLASWKNGKLTQYPEVAEQFVESLFQDQQGAVWLGLALPGRACTVHGDKISCSGAGTLGEGASVWGQDRDGGLWVAAGSGMWRWSPDLREHVADAPGAPVTTDTGRGELVLATNDGLKRISGRQVRAFALPGIPPRSRTTTSLRSADGTLWVGTPQGLLHLHDGILDKFTAADGLSGDFVLKLFEDREGNIWVSTKDGLDRFRKFAITTYSTKEGLSNSAANSVVADSEGNVWISTEDRLNRLQHGRTTTLPIKSRALAEDDQGRLWISTSDGVGYLAHGRFVRVPGIPGANVASIAPDRLGRVWISNADVGLLYVAPTGVLQRFSAPRLREKLGATALLPDHARGGVWLGFFDGGVAHFERGQLRASYGVANGLGAGHVHHLLFGSDGAIWAATQGGLSRLEGDRVATMTSRDGLPCDAVHWAIEDNDRAFWLYMACGLVRISRAEVNAWVRDVRHPVTFTIFDMNDGSRSRALINSYSPYVTKAPDGRIWFVQGDGVSVIERPHLDETGPPPPVRVEQITADGTTYDVDTLPNGRLSLPPHTRVLAIDYTALSLRIPEKVHFRFRLDGQDPSWREVVNQRRVEYSNLPPGDYHFRLTAANNAAAWNDAGTSLDFTITPAFYQTNWFRALCVLGALGALSQLYRLRIRQLQLQEARFRETVEMMPAMAFTTQADGMPAFVNRRWIDYTGMTLEETTRSGWQAVTHAEDFERIQDTWRASLSSGEPLEFEVRLRAANGSYRWFASRAVPVRDKRGQITKWYGVSTDIEERKQGETERERLRELEADLAHVNRVTTMGELTASVAHEIRQPIAATIMNANASLRWLERPQPDLHEVREATRRILQDGERAGEIISRLRSLYTKAPPRREPVDVNDVIRELLLLLRGEATRQGVSIGTVLAEDLPMVVGDRVQLQQVFMNLVLNGIEAMRESHGGALTVTSAVDVQGGALFSVADHGIGLPSGKADQIFEAFFTTKSQGSGMGLAISRSIVESHGGRLWATSNDQRGAIFCFTLPSAVVDDPPASSGSAPT